MDWTSAAPAQMPRRQYLSRAAGTRTAAEALQPPADDEVSEAVAVLRQAEDISPELVAGHEQVRQLVSDLLTMQDPPSAELRELARRPMPAPRPPLPRSGAASGAR